MIIKRSVPFINDKPYNTNLLTRDLIAGFTLFVMLVPQGMAYAMLAGLPPVMGLYASTLPVLIYALFASSRHLSVGPTAITSLLVFSVISVFATPGTSEYITLVILLALMVGVFQFLFGLFKLGFIVRFISPAVLGGYTSAAAIVIALSQLKHLLGIEGGNYFQIHLLLSDVVGGLGQIHWPTFLVGTGSISLLILLKRASRRIPAALLLILVSILAVYSLGLHERGVSIIGEVPSGFPSLVLPAISVEVVRQILLPALTIALLGFMESLAIGKAIADKEKYKLDPNRELKALGAANMLGPFFQAFPINGSFSRSAVNHQSGGVTQLVSVFTSLFMTLTLFFFTSFFYYLPNAALAAIIMVAVYKLVNFAQFWHLLKIKAVDGWIWVATFAVTLFIGIQWGILLGAGLSYLLLLSKLSQPNINEVGYVHEDKTFRNVARFPRAQTKDGLIMLRIDASINFANIPYFEDKVRQLLAARPETKTIITDFKSVNDMDAPSFGVLEDIIVQLKQEKGIQFYFVGMKGPIRDTASNAGWDHKFPEEIRYFSLEQLLKDKNIRFHAPPKDNIEQAPFMYMI
ncbi:sulfate permease [Bacillus sp. FJAT-27251]|uniref:SulP family inorganic anion transporter n=1 Tax=Bacillus sp. FJAT-27251 TaxID=1684142 RepID=UPI0006A75F03|nr:sulfate permease [Bacillus sp. FJAT-27251]